jgi:hypothetical protein
LLDRGCPDSLFQHQRVTDYLPAQEGHAEAKFNELLARRTQQLRVENV